MNSINDAVSDALVMPSYYGMLNSEWEFKSHDHGEPADVYSWAPIVHFSASGKPWSSVVTWRAIRQSKPGE